MKDFDKISELISCFLLGKADSRQTTQLEEWLDASEQHKKIFRQLCRDLEQEHHYVRVDTVRALRSVERRVNERRATLRYWFAAAAAVLIFLTAAGVYLMRPIVVPQPVTDWGEVAAEVVLTLPDGSRRSLDDTSSPDLQGVCRDSLGVLRIEAPETQTTESYEIAVGTGPEQALCLADGTRVWLGNGSRLRFPLRFNEGRRCVEASGEVYFDVAHIAGQPFIVSTNGSSVSVFGTEFLVQNQEDRTRTTLIDGSVAFTAPDGSSVHLVPGKQVETSGAGVVVREVDIQLYTALRDGYLVFDQMTIAQIAARLESRYECRIRLGNPDVAAEIISARIWRYSTLRPILDLLSKVGHFEYKEDGGEIVIE